MHGTPLCNPLGGLCLFQRGKPSDLSAVVKEGDERRRGLARRWLGMARASQSLRPDWLADVAAETRHVAGQLAELLHHRLMWASHSPDTALKDEVKGSLFVGPLPPVHWLRDDRTSTPKGVPLSVTELSARRLEFNQVVLAGVREQSWPF